MQKVLEMNGIKIILGIISIIAGVLFALLIIWLSKPKYKRCSECKKMFSKADVIDLGLKFICRNCIAEFISQPAYSIERKKSWWRFWR